MAVTGRVRASDGTEHDVVLSDPVVNAGTTTTPPTVGVPTVLPYGSGNTANIPVPGGSVLPSDVDLAFVYTDGGFNPTVTPPAGFTQAPNSPVVAGSSSVRWRVYWRRPTAGDTAATYNFGFSAAGARAGIAVRVRNCVPSGDPFDGTISASAVGVTQIPAVSLQTTVANDRLLYTVATYDGAAVTPPAGFTEDVTSSARSIYDQARAAAGSTGSLTGTLSPADDVVVWLCALKPGTATPPPPSVPTITSIVPNPGPAGQVTINGAGFVAGTLATFGGAGAATAVVSQTQLLCSAPAHADGAVPVVVTNVNGSATATFTYQASIPLPPPAAGLGLVTGGIYEWGTDSSYAAGLTAQLPQIIRLCSRDAGDGRFTEAAALSPDMRQMWTLLPPVPSGTPEWQVWTPAGVIAEADRVLNRWGPGGTYFQQNPSSTYKPIEAVEILNEPNGFMLGNKQGDAANAPLYADILIQSYAHIKARWPSVTVVGFSVMEVEALMSNWVPLVFAADPRVAHSFDVFSWHPYFLGDTQPDGVAYPPEQYIVEGWGRYLMQTEVNNLKAQFAKYAINPPMWITETGNKVFYSEGGRQNYGGCVSLATQAAWNVRIQVCAARWGSSRIYWMYSNDDAGNWGWFDNSSPPKPRPTLAAGGNTNRMLADAIAIHPLVPEQWGTNNPFVYQFDTKSGGLLICAWSQNPQTVPITLDRPVTVFDMFGAQVGQAPAGTYQAALKEAPIWLKS